MFRLQKDLLKPARPAALFALAGVRHGDACAPAEETWNGHAQSTHSWQAKPAFPAAHTGPNSLLSQRETAYALSATAAFGLRAWERGELCFDPDVVQGKALCGLGGMTNREQQRTSGTNPTLYRAQLFLRQTWNFKGAPVRLDSDMNQLAGSVSSRRVLTAGHFALNDIVDANAYAHDARSRFVNRTPLDNGAYDFAADARGYSRYSWGAVPEYIDGDWAVRYGRARKERSKIDFGVNFEQSLGPGVAAFARARWNDGASETYSFAAIERSVSAGVSVDGAAWQRAGGTLGAAPARNLSQAHRDYLAAGGLAAFIGDGRLDYRAEQIIGMYSRVDLARVLGHGLQFSPDAQHIVNPAYNRLRGPVNVGSIRLHGQY